MREEQFKKLNDELKKINRDLTIICAGGYILEKLGIRTTIDVDAFFTSDKEIDGIIKKVGEELSINSSKENWLNNSIQNLNEIPPIEECQTDYSFSNLTVYSVPVEYLIGMKMKSMREKDIFDISRLIKILKIINPEELEAKLNKRGFNPDSSIILECFAEAYGIEWLSDYLMKIEENKLKEDLKKDRQKEDRPKGNDYVR
ncbi:DUF6036 family nucleotidyltransferase [Peptoniphilus sp. GNH]|nr:DUF6036 family nucleotidyltransferase [Peptoniphilus sp. GNH]